MWRFYTMKSYTVISFFFFFHSHFKFFFFHSVALHPKHTSIKLILRHLPLWTMWPFEGKAFTVGFFYLSIQCYTNGHGLRPSFSFFFGLLLIDIFGPRFMEGRVLHNGHFNKFKVMISTILKHALYRYPIQFVRMDKKFQVWSSIRKLVFGISY